MAGAVGGEVSGSVVGESIGGSDRVAGERADALGALAHLGARDRLPVLGDAGEAPLGIAGQEAHHVQQMSAQHHQILAAAAKVLLAARPHLQQVADPPVRDQVSRNGEPGAVARLVADRQLHTGSPARLDHLVRFLQGAS